MKQLLFLLLLCTVFVSTACGQPPKGLGENEIVTTQKLSSNETQIQFRVETVATNLEVPWGFAFLPNGDLLFTERPGRVRLIEGGKLKAEPVFTVPDVQRKWLDGCFSASQICRKPLCLSRLRLSR
jgi:glucose/arabinose dehydrogenase